MFPSNDNCVEPLIYDDHTKMCHAGVDIGLTHLQEQLWIVKDRKYVKKTLNDLSLVEDYVLYCILVILLRLFKWLIVNSKWWKRVDNTEVINDFSSKDSLEIRS
ncbi:hypothetical protein NPIL_595781 [Nephila pilipes]|uniref:Uncharacterized protein n=1 Tax=Nephila pilipes TaxID=299642 RepID=A0A8X6URC3_NEPPI|nr:hypothetical protein NPIL_595781 [Nephila pilipes]